MSAHALSTSKNHITGSFEKSFGEICGSIQCWGPPVTGLQVIVLWLRRLFRVRGLMSQPFAVAVAFGQGCVLPPLLFIVYMKWIDSHSQIDEGITYCYAFSF